MKSILSAPIRYPPPLPLQAHWPIRKKSDDEKQNQEWNVPDICNDETRWTKMILRHGPTGKICLYPVDRRTLRIIPICLQEAYYTPRSEPRATPPSMPWIPMPWARLLTRSAMMPLCTAASGANILEECWILSGRLTSTRSILSCPVLSEFSRLIPSRPVHWKYFTFRYILLPNGIYC